MTQAGPAIPVIAVTDRYADGGPALRVAVVSDGRPTEAGPARPVIVVADGRPTQGNEPIPVIVATGAQASHVMAGPATPIVIVSGGSVQPNMLYSNKVNALGPIAYWPLAESSGSVANDESGNGRNGAYTAVTLGQPGIGDGRTAALFVPASSSRCAIHSASLAAAFSGAEGTLALWVKVSAAGVWTDGVARYMAQLQADASNLVYIRKNTTNNQMQFVYVAGGTSEAVVATYSGVGWSHFAITWNKAAEQVKAYTNGAQTGSTQTALGTWAGSLAAAGTVIGASSTAGVNPWDGTIAHPAIFPTALSAAQIAALATV